MCLSQRLSLRYVEKMTFIRSSLVGNNFYFLIKLRYLHFFCEILLRDMVIGMLSESLPLLRGI